MPYAQGNRYLSIPEVKNKSGKYSNESIDRIAQVHDTFKNVFGSVTGGKAKVSDEPKIMTAVGVKETTLKDTPRGYLFNFDDTKDQAGYKAEAMRRGKLIAQIVAAKKNMLGAASPSDVYKYDAGTIAKAVRGLAADDVDKNTDIAAAHVIMQNKMNKSDSLKEGLQRWRSKTKEPEYPSHVVAIAKKLS